MCAKKQIPHDRKPRAQSRQRTTGSNTQPKETRRAAAATCSRNSAGINHQHMQKMNHLRPRFISGGAGTPNALQVVMQDFQTVLQDSAKTRSLKSVEIGYHTLK